MNNEGKIPQKDKRCPGLAGIELIFFLGQRKQDVLRTICVGEDPTNITLCHLNFYTLHLISHPFPASLRGNPYFNTKLGNTSEIFKLSPCPHEELSALSPVVAASKITEDKKLGSLKHKDPIKIESQNYIQMPQNNQNHNCSWGLLQCITHHHLPELQFSPAITKAEGKCATGCSTIMV